VSRAETPGGRVVVVGGGLAGLAAALACADAGAAVTLLEARPRLGGATFSFRRDGLTVDNGQHVFLRCCTAYRGFLRRIGSEGRVVLQRRMAIPVVAPGGRVSWLRRSALPAPLHLARSLATYRHLTLNARSRAGLTALALRRLDPADPALDRISFGAWLRARREPVGAIEALWELIALPTLNLRADGASLALAAMVFRTGLLTDSAAADVGYARVPLSELHGEPAARALERTGARVHLRAAVRAVAPGEDGEWRVRLDDGTVDADAVVVAVPHDRAKAMLPPGATPTQRRWDAIGFSPIVNVHVLYDRPVMTAPFVAGIRSPVQWAFDRGAVTGAPPGRFLAVSISGAHAEIDERVETLRVRFLPALAEILPAARGAGVDRFFVTREPRATIRQEPGVGALRPPQQTNLPGLALAGAWTDTGWPATMESAVRSGLAAAREVLAAGRHKPVPDDGDTSVLAAEVAS
jgi:squalene-associated FAD-dependent desaturase